MNPDQIGERLFQSIEQNSHLFATLSDEVKAHIKTLLNAQVENLGLVTREEFDAMRTSLDRAVERVAKLESDASS